jgi:hypothetical protein
MKRALLLVTVALVAITESATAQQMTYTQGGEPAFSVTYPVGWEIRTPRTEGRNVISAYPTDGSLLWQGMWLMRDSASVEDSLARLEAMETGLFSDSKLIKEPWTEQLRDLTLHCFMGSGTYREDQTVETFMALFQLPGNRVGALGYIGDPEAIKAHAEGLHSLLQSLEVAE